MLIDAKYQDENYKFHDFINKRNNSQTHSARFGIGKTFFSFPYDRQFKNPYYYGQNLGFFDSFHELIIEGELDDEIIIIWIESLRIYSEKVDNFSADLLELVKPTNKFLLSQMLTMISLNANIEEERNIMFYMRIGLMDLDPAVRLAALNLFELVALRDNSEYLTRSYVHEELVKILIKPLYFCEYSEIFSLYSSFYLRNYNIPGKRYLKIFKNLAKYATNESIFTFLLIIEKLLLSEILDPKEFFDIFSEDQLKNSKFFIKRLLHLSITMAKNLDKFPTFFYYLHSSLNSVIYIIDFSFPWEKIKYLKCFQYILDALPDDDAKKRILIRNLCRQKNFDFLRDEYSSIAIYNYFKGLVKNGTFEDLTHLTDPYMCSYLIKSFQNFGFTSTSVPGNFFHILLESLLKLGFEKSQIRRLFQWTGMENLIFNLCYCNDELFCEKIIFRNVHMILRNLIDD